MTEDQAQDDTNQSDAVVVPELTIGQVQWHCSEEGGSPDVGILMRLDKAHLLWVGELLNHEGGGHGIVIYGPGEERRLVSFEYNDLRQLFEDIIAPAIRTPGAGGGKG